MSSDVEIKIFGKVSDPEAVFELASAAAEEGKLEWHGDIDTADFVDMLAKAADEGRPIVLMRGHTTNFFDGVTSACQEVGLSYVVSYGLSGGEGFSKGFSWKPGMLREREFLLDGCDPVLSVDCVRRAAEKGDDAVMNLVNETVGLVEVGKIELEPGFLEAYREYAGYDATATAP